jgi:carboxymethylenebutenolidase
MTAIATRRSRALLGALVAGGLLGGCAQRPGNAADSTATTTGAASSGATHHGEWVRIASGADSVRAYVAYPERSAKAPAVIVIHENTGLTPWEVSVADRLAGAGYVALAPDLLSSKFGSTPAAADSGRQLIGQLEPDRVTADLNAVFAWLDTLPAVRAGEIATIGFCWGGGQSFRYATNNPKLKAAVVCYGPAPDSAALARIEAPLLGVYGEDDARINAALPQVTATLQSLGKDFTHAIYPGTGHGFLKPGRNGSDTPAVDSAWANILAFYGEKLQK